MLVDRQVRKLREAYVIHMLDEYKMKFKKLLILIILIWLLLVTASFLWSYTSARNEQKNIAFQTARSFFEHIVITRLWNARHGGVYVPITEKTLPNPYLDVPMRDIPVNDKLTLTKINPAFMTRQISEIAKEFDGIQFHITSLKPIRPQNKPTAKEKQFLRKFEQGVKEKGGFIQKGGKIYYFYMAPLITKKACLKCHAGQGNKVGDIRGGISVTVPFVMNIPLLPLLIGHILIAFIGILGIIIAGKKLSQAYETIQKQAVIDALTGIPNRRSFSETLLKEFGHSYRNQEPLSVIMCDIDNFKMYNDTYGHIKGDMCLQKVAQAIKASLKRSTDFCARYGGEEFVILLPNTSLDGAIYVAERIRLNIEKMRILNKNSLPAGIVTLSLGVSSSEGVTVFEPETIIKNADTALYKAKEQGRNQVQAFREVT